MQLIFGIVVVVVSAFMAGVTLQSALIYETCTENQRMVITGNEFYCTKTINGYGSQEGIQP